MKTVTVIFLAIFFSNIFVEAQTSAGKTIWKDSYITHDFDTIVVHFRSDHSVNGETLFKSLYSGSGEYQIKGYDGINPTYVIRGEDLNKLKGEIFFLSFNGKGIELDNENWDKVFCLIDEFFARAKDWKGACWYDAKGSVHYF